MLSPTLSIDPTTSFELLKKHDSAKQAALALEVPEHQLLHILFERPKASYYQTFEIPKKRGGTRTISAPSGALAILQQKVLAILAPHYKPASWIHGFVPERSICTNAAPHTKRAIVINLDIEDFYGSINFGRVRGILQLSPWKLGPNVATVIARIVTFQNRLPQGACTSPLMANAVAWPLDRKMIALAKEHHLTYTRYADDITFSTTKRKISPNLIGGLEPDPVTGLGPNPVTGPIYPGPQLERAVVRAGFKINRNKLRVQPPFVRQEATGLTVNQFPNVERSFVRKVRALIHSWRTRSLLPAELHHIEHHAKAPPKTAPADYDGTYFKNVIYGCLAYLRQVRGKNDRLYLKFCSDVALLDPNPPPFITQAKDLLDMYDFFICHASEDKDAVVRPMAEALRKQGAKVFVDEDYINLGDSFVKKINAALGRSKHVIAVISDSSYKKHWPSTELRNVLAMEASKGNKLLPIMVGDDTDIKRFLGELPLLSERLYHQWELTADAATNIAAAVPKLMAAL